MTNISNDVMGYKVVANNEVKMFNNVDDVVDYVVMMMKKHPNNAVYVNDMGIRLERELDGKISVVLRDSNMNLIRGYVMGKIKRGMDKAVAYVLSYIEENEVEEQEDNTIVDDVDRVVKVIEDYVNNYTMSYLDNYGGCVVCVPWDIFNEDDMKMLIEDDGFEGCVVGVLMGRDIKDVLVYDDGVYVSVDAKMFDKVA